jgi:hypothetical protein
MFASAAALHAVPCLNPLETVLVAVQVEQREQLPVEKLSKIILKGIS